LLIPAISVATYIILGHETKKLNTNVPFDLIDLSVSVFSEFIARIAGLKTIGKRSELLGEKRY